MKIKWYGQSCFSLKDGNTTIVTDPFNEEIGLKLPDLKVDIVSISHNYSDYSSLEEESSMKIVDWPGEYDIKEVLLTGVEIDNESQETKEKTTIFKMNINGLEVCNLGNINKNLTEKELEKIGSVDVLFIPVGGNTVIDAKEAKKIIEEIEPKIVIPMYYKLPELNFPLDTIDKFLTEMSVSNVEAVTEFDINKKDLSSDRTEVVVLKPEN